MCFIAATDRSTIPHEKVCSDDPNSHPHHPGSMIEHELKHLPQKSHPSTPSTGHTHTHHQLSPQLRTNQHTTRGVLLQDFLGGPLRTPMTPVFRQHNNLRFLYRYTTLSIVGSFRRRQQTQQHIHVNATKRKLAVHGCTDQVTYLFGAQAPRPLPLGEHLPGVALESRSAAVPSRLHLLREEIGANRPSFPRSLWAGRRTTGC